MVTWQIGTEQSPTGIDVMEIYGNRGDPTSRQRKLATIPKKLFLAEQTNKAGTGSNFSGFELKWTLLLKAFTRLVQSSR